MSEPKSKHPKGLYVLFFTEMWERLAFYTMLGILLLYATDFERGGLGLPSANGNEIYGLYLAFVYFTPFLGGMIADRFLGYRRAVLIGGALMAAGLFSMGVKGFVPFTTGLVLLICGNGLFKPNISVMVGNLYEPGDPKRDAGFNIFYMGINIGALIATVLAATVRNDLGWLWTFRVAGIGLLVGLGILLFNWKNLERADRRPERSPDDTSFTQLLLKIIGPAFVIGIAGYFLAGAYLPADFAVRPAICGFLAGMIPVIFFFVKMAITAKPDEKPGLLALLPIYIAGGTFFMILHLNGSAMTQWARDNTDRNVQALPAAILQEAFPQYYLNATESTPLPDPSSLAIVEEVKIARMYGLQRMDEAAVAAVGSLPGIQVVEVNGSDRATEAWSKRAADVYADGMVKVVEERDSHGASEVSIAIPDGAKPVRRVAFVREAITGKIATYVTDRQTADAIYSGYEEKFGKKAQLLPPGQFLPVANPELYQSFNPLFVIFLTPVVVGLFQFLVNRKRGVSTARKLLIGLTLTTISLLVMALAGFLSDNGSLKVSGLWLASFYLIITFGELCLSPMGLSLVTKLSPKRLVGLTMGGWFMASAFGNNFSGFFGGIQGKMEPASFFLVLAGLAGLSSLFIFLLLPKLDEAIKKYGG